MAATFSSFNAAAVGALNALQVQYVALHPGAVSVPAEFYLSPYYQGGENVRCAWSADGCLLAYAVFYAQNEQAWVEIRCRPEAEGADELRDALLGWLWQRAGAGGQAQLAFQYLPDEHDAIAFARARGAQPAYAIYAMARDLSQPLAECPMPAGYTLRQLRMTSPAEQQEYVAARSECFPEAPVSLEEWQYFCQAPVWQAGVVMAGFAGETLASGVTVFWEPGSPLGLTEYIFTRAAHRGKGLARALISAALCYLREHGLRTAALEVKAENQQALGLYANLGYQVVRESQVLINPAKLS